MSSAKLAFLDCTVERGNVIFEDSWVLVGFHRVVVFSSYRAVIEEMPLVRCRKANASFTIFG